MDGKQNQSVYLDDIITASSGNVSENDLLIWKVADGDGSWELLKADDATYNVTASRVEYGNFFINDAGINGQYWSSMVQKAVDGEPMVPVLPLVYTLNIRKNKCW